MPSQATKIEENYKYIAEIKIKYFFEKMLC